MISVCPSCLPGPIHLAYSNQSGHEVTVSCLNFSSTSSYYEWLRLNIIPKIRYSKHNTGNIGEEFDSIDSPGRVLLVCLLALHSMALLSSAWRSASHQGLDSLSSALSPLWGEHMKSESGRTEQPPAAAIMASATGHWWSLGLLLRSQVRRGAHRSLGVTE